MRPTNEHYDREFHRIRITHHFQDSIAMDACIRATLNQRFLQNQKWILTHRKQIANTFTCAFRSSEAAYSEDVRIRGNSAELPWRTVLAQNNDQTQTQPFPRLIKPAQKRCLTRWGSRERANHTIRKPRQTSVHSEILRTLHFFRGEEQF
jgi:hypothetical protein